MNKHILTAIVLLLNLFTYGVAQRRGDAFNDARPNQTLEGLGQIGFIVKYGQADGLPESMRLSILQMLKDRATDLLTKEEVPLLKSKDETDMRGRPRLVVTVTLKKPNDAPPALQIETELYQRVRLSRDPAKELEVATWSTGRVASEITEKMLWSLLEEQLQGFIKTYREVNTNTQAKNRNVESLTRFKENANPLDGLNGIGVMVSISFIRREGVPPTDLGPRITSPEFYRTLQIEAERKLRQAGIPLLRYETERPGHPLFTLNITVGQPNLNHSPAIGVVSTFWQTVRLSRNPQKETYTETWKSRASEGEPITEDAVLKSMNSQLDEFIRAYKTANPKPALEPVVKAQ